MSKRTPNKAGKKVEIKIDEKQEESLKSSAGAAGTSTGKISFKKKG
jgi:hypothetical protein